MAKESDLGSWPVEPVPNNHYLFMGVHRNWLKPNGEVRASAFKNHGNGMSTDWSRYSTPEQTRHRRRKPQENLVVQMEVKQVRGISGQSVEHSPLPENRAHTDVLGEKNEEARVMLRRAATIVVPLSL